MGKGESTFLFFLFNFFPLARSKGVQWGQWISNERKLTYFFSDRFWEGRGLLDMFAKGHIEEVGGTIDG